MSYSVSVKNWRIVLRRKNKNGDEKQRTSIYERSCAKVVIFVCLSAFCCFCGFTWRCNFKMRACIILCLISAHWLDMKFGVTFSCFLKNLLIAGRTVRTLVVLYIPQILDCTHLLFNTNVSPFYGVFCAV